MVLLNLQISQSTTKPTKKNCAASDDSDQPAHQVARSESSLVANNEDSDQTAVCRLIRVFLCRTRLSVGFAVHRLTRILLFSVLTVF